MFKITFDICNMHKSWGLKQLYQYLFLNKSHCIQYKLYSNSKTLCIAHQSTVHKPARTTCTHYELSSFASCIKSWWSDFQPIIYTIADTFFTMLWHHQLTNTSRGSMVSRSTFRNACTFLRKWFWSSSWMFYWYYTSFYSVTQSEFIIHWNLHLNRITLFKDALQIPPSAVLVSAI